MEKVKLNNQIISMRKYVKQAKVHAINKLVKQIKILQNRKGNETHVQKAKRKAERFLEAVALIKKTKPDEISKLALLKAKDWKDVLQQKNSNLQDRCIAMLANYGAVQKEVEVFYGANKELVLKISDYFAQWEEKNKLSKDLPKSNKISLIKKTSKAIHQANPKDENLLSNMENRIKTDMETKSESGVESKKPDIALKIPHQKSSLKSKDSDGDIDDKEDKIVFVQKSNSNKNPIRIIEKSEEDLHSDENSSMESEELDNSDEESESSENKEANSNSLNNDNKVKDTNKDENIINKTFNYASKSDIQLEIANNAKNKLKAITLLNLNELEGLDEIPVGSSARNDEMESSEDEINDNSQTKSSDPFFLVSNKEDSMQNKSSDLFFLGHKKEDSSAEESDNFSKGTGNYNRNEDSARSFNYKTQTAEKNFHRRGNKISPKKSFQDSSYIYRNPSRNFQNEKSYKKPFTRNKFASKNYHNKFQGNDGYNRNDFRQKNKPFPPRNSYDNKQFNAVSKTYENKDNTSLKNKVPYKKSNTSTTLHPSWEAKRKQKEILSTSFQGKRTVFND